ncbi:MAG: ABC-type phosphate transport system substrate-binding protein [Oceanicoccus sp.]|jgi:ABC-type phosphate transport system substrate-binding protein
MKFKNLVFTVLFVLLSQVAQGEIAVVVHPSNSASTLDAATIQLLFLGKLNAFPDGQKSIPLSLSDSHPIRLEFNSSVLKKTEGQYKAFWSKMMFTGKGIPPKEQPSGKEILDLVSKNPNMIGYMDASEVDGSVKVVAKF